MLAVYQQNKSLKSQDKDAAEVVRRIIGVTVVDNRFINVRVLMSVTIRFGSTMQWLPVLKRIKIIFI